MPLEDFWSEIYGSVYRAIQLYWDQKVIHPATTNRLVSSTHFHPVDNPQDVELEQEDSHSKGSIKC
jgi:hypothetical protein